MRRCERLLARSALLDTTGIDWDAVGSVPVAAPVLDCLVYMRDVEAFTNRYLAGLVAHPATLADRQIARFLPIWQAEEGAHAAALDHYLTQYARRTGTSLPSVATPPPIKRSERWLVTLTRPVGHIVTAAHMTWGAANELLTMTGYRLLAHRCGDPVLEALLLRIAAQESRHYGFYRLQAEWRLAASPTARRVLAGILRRSWTPVGVGDGFKRPEEFDRVLLFLANDADGQRAARSMDATMSRLPGCSQLQIFAAAVAASCRRNDVSPGAPARSGGRTRTPNNWTRTSCVADYTTPEGGACTLPNRRDPASRPAGGQPPSMSSMMRSSRS